MVEKKKKGSIKLRWNTEVMFSKRKPLEVFMSSSTECPTEVLGTKIKKKKKIQEKNNLGQ